MFVIQARNVNDALESGTRLLQKYGKPIESRGGMVLEAPMPVATVYACPQERVLLHHERDPNPFFHFFESLWVLAGRSDVKFLTEFNKQMAEYSDDGYDFNAAYGYRMRRAFAPMCDQISEIVSILKADPYSRQAVAQIWHPADLVHVTKDKACNMSVVFSIRDGKLNIIVYNRSNDMLWGCYGTNVVQFSMLQEYVAAHLSVKVGTYTQVSNSFHVYTDGKAGEMWDRVKANPAGAVDFYQPETMLVLMNPGEMGSFDADLALFFDRYDSAGIENVLMWGEWGSPYFRKLAIPMLHAWWHYKASDPYDFTHLIAADDWRMAAQLWLNRRVSA